MKIIAIMPDIKYDYLAHAVIEGLQKINATIFATSRMKGVKGIPVYSDDQIINEAKTADYILVIWGKSPGKYYLLDEINRPEVTAYIDGSEWTYTGYPNPKPGQASEAKYNYSRRRGEPWINKEMLTKAKWYFKRECYQRDIDEYGCIPFPFAILGEYYTHKPKTNQYDIFCAFGQVYTGLRAEVEQACIELGKEGYKVMVGRNFSRNAYFDYMSKSLICVDALGGGDCNARRWEILASKSCLFSEQYNIVIPRDFTNEENIVNYKTLDEFKEKILYYIENKREAIKIGELGYDHAMKYHTSKKRIEYLFNIMRD